MNFPNPFDEVHDFPISSLRHVADDPDNTLAIDWETFYTKDYSLRNMSAIAYVMDKQFDPYLVALYGKVGGQDVRLCGRPHTIPWDQILKINETTPIRFLAHNASFDEIVTWRYLSHLHPERYDLRHLTTHMNFLCTADLAAYLKYPRPLAGLSLQLGLQRLDKTVRDEMKGVDFQNDENLTPRVLAYAMLDAKNCYLAWNKLHTRWPEHERAFSICSRRRAYRGVPVNIGMMEDGIKRLEEVKVEAAKGIPWDWSKNLTPLSPIAMRKQCIEDEVPIPASFAEDKSEEWEEEYSEKVEWVKHARDWRKANTHGTRLSRMRANTIDDTSYMHFQQMYCGAHTGRSSGSGGINMQNMPWGDVVGGVNIRHMIEAPKGYKVMIADYNQIEPRLLYQQAGMQHVLDLIRDGMHPYEAHARATMGYTQVEPLKKYDELLYKMAKFRVIGLGYGCGWRKFKELCKKANFLMEDEEAERQVLDYRESHAAIVNYWYEHDQWLQTSARAGDRTYSFQLLSGRLFEIFDPQFVFDPDSQRSELKARKTRGDHLLRMWGGTMTENEIQATGMDIMKYAITHMPEEYLKYWLLDSHDELVFLLPESDYLDMGRDILKHMTNVPWLPSDFPLEADADYTERYMKT